MNRSGSSAPPHIAWPIESGQFAVGARIIQLLRADEIHKIEAKAAAAKPAPAKPTLRPGSGYFQNLQGDSGMNSICITEVENLPAAARSSNLKLRPLKNCSMGVSPMDFLPENTGETPVLQGISKASISKLKCLKYKI